MYKTNKEGNIIIMDNKDFLNWIADRLVLENNDRGNCDFIIRLRELADSFSEQNNETPTPTLDSHQEAEKKIRDDIADGIIMGKRVSDFKRLEDKFTICIDNEFLTYPFRPEFKKGDILFINGEILFYKKDGYTTKHYSSLSDEGFTLIIGKDTKVFPMNLNIFDIIKKEGIDI